MKAEAPNDSNRIETAGLATRQNLLDLLELYANDLTEPVENIVRKSDKYVDLACNGLYRLPLLSAIHGYEFVDEVPKNEMHKYAYSEEFDCYLREVAEDTDRLGELERHFFTHGIAIGIFFKHAS